MLSVFVQTLDNYLFINIDFDLLFTSSSNADLSADNGHTY